jgi:hypothetical protein
MCIIEVFNVYEVISILFDWTCNGIFLFHKTIRLYKLTIFIETLYIGLTYATMH